MKRLVVLLLLLLFARDASGQDARGGFIAIGWHHADVDALNSRLVANGYPEFGGGAQLDIQSRATVSFDELLDNPGRTASVSNMALMFGPQLGAHVFLPRGPIARGMILGIRAGYLFSTLESDWGEIDGESVNGGPEMDFSGAHITVFIGGWGLKR